MQDGVLRRREVAAEVGARADELRSAVDLRHVSADFRANGNHDAVVRVHRLGHRARDRLSDALQPNSLVERDAKRTSRSDDEIDRGLIGLGGAGLSASSRQQAARPATRSRSRTGAPPENEPSS